MVVIAGSKIKMNAEDGRIRTCGLMKVKIGKKSISK
jgi:hypothetical protein